MIFPEKYRFYDIIVTLQFTRVVVITVQTCTLGAKHTSVCLTASNEPSIEGIFVMPMLRNI